MDDAMDDSMDDLVEFRTESGDGASIIVATSVDNAYGARPISRPGRPDLIPASRTFESSLEGARAAAEAALRVFRDGRLKPDSVEIEFGVKITAETGAILVKGSAEGHLVVKLAWSPKRREVSDNSADPAASEASGTSAAPEASSPPEASEPSAEPPTPEHHSTTSTANTTVTPTPGVS